MSNISVSTFALWCLAAYLAGSIPFGLVLMKLAGKGDVRKSGSGNIGATNVLRTGGKVLGIVTLLLDIAKGFIPVYLARRFGLPPQLLSFVALAGVVGHIFTPWLRFEGGKGVATALGVALAYHPLMVLPSLAAFILLLAIFRYVSLGSIVSALVLIPAAMGLFGIRFSLPVLEAYARWPILAWSLIALLVVRRHAGNIQRLIAGTESKLWGSSKASAETGPEPAPKPAQDEHHG